MSKRASLEPTEYVLVRSITSSPYVCARILLAPVEATLSYYYSYTTVGHCRWSLSLFGSEHRIGSRPTVHGPFAVSTASRNEIEERCTGGPWSPNGESGGWWVHSCLHIQYYGVLRTDYS